MKLPFTIVLFVLALNTNAQVKTLHPDTEYQLNFDKSEQKLIDRQYELLEAEKLSEDEQKELDTLLQKYGETVTDIWQSVGDGCSWYCGGGPYKITATSFLRPNSKIDYKPENIHDFSYKTVWAEGADGYGIGESITYHFKAGSPRITEIKIANGYVKTDKAWRENSRVKKLKMYINDEPYAILELNDAKSLQTYKLERPIGRNNGDNDWVLKFEILEVHKGDKYKDVVISELFFDGIDVH